MALWKRDNTWWADVTVNGRRYRQSLKTSDKREAKSLEKEFVAAVQAGSVGSPSGKSYARLPFDQAAKIYVEERVGRVAERTTQFERERLVPLLRHLKACPLSKLTPERIARYQQARITEGVSGRTINMETSIVRRMLKKAKLWAPMAEDVKLYRETSHIGRALSVEEKKRLFETAMRNPRWLVAHCAAVLAVSTTCRGVELKNLRWKHVNLFDRVVRVERSKNESGRREIPLNPDAIAALKNLLDRAQAIGSAEPDHFVFPACENNRFDSTKHQKSWVSAWRSLTKAAGLPGFRFHDLRHTAITELAESGAADATLMAISGHMTREMLEHYSHVRMQTKRTALDGISSGLMGERGSAEAPVTIVQ